jgi:citrate synthase
MDPPPMASNVTLVPSSEAARRLGVKPSTLYAYVSRGLIASHQRPGRRGSWFDPAELDGLARRGRGRGSAQRPDVVIESAVTLIDDGRYWYRGHDPVELSRTASFEAVAELLWTGRLAPEVEPWEPHARASHLAAALAAALPSDAPAVDHLRAAVPVIAAHDPLRGDLRPEAVVDVARRLLATVGAVLPRLGPAPPAGASLAGLVWAVVTTSDPAEAEVAALQAVMILMADHELAASTSAVRIAASYRADPYAAVMAGLAALAGTFHGGASVLVEQFLTDVTARGAARVVGDWLAREDRLPGLGQPLYPAGDPRAPVVLDLARRLRPDAPAVDAADAVLAITTERGFPPLNVDFAVAVLSGALGWAPRSGELVFAVARMAGWLAHALEEYQSRSSLRLRALYVGPRPD